MVTTILHSSLFSHSRSRFAPVAALAFALAMLVSAPAMAALREYRVEFAPSSSTAATGYTLHIGSASRNYSTDFDLGSPPAAGGTVIYAIDLEDSVDLFVALRSYDGVGAQSVYSNEIRVAAVIPPPPPPPPVEEDPGAGDPGEEDPGTDPGEEEPGADPEGGDPGNGGLPGGGGAGDPPGNPMGDGDRLGLTATSAGLISALVADGSLDFLTMDSLASKANLRPTRCDLDGDGDGDLVIGFGAGSRGQVAVIFFNQGAVSRVRSIEAGTAAYRKRSGRTNPGCGDLDGDGRAELVIGFDLRMRGVVQVFDDMLTGFSPLASARTDADGFMQIPVPDGFWGSVYPAIGDIDGDGRDELVAGLGRTTGGGRLAILDDAMNGFAVHAANRTGTSWVPVDPNPSKKSGRTRSMPAVGDLDGDGRDEVVVSFGSGSRARVAILDDAVDGFPMTSADARILVTGRSTYQRRDGATHSAIGDVDGDGNEELVVGFRRSGKRELQVFDDQAAGMGPMGDDEGFVSAIDSTTALFPAPLD